jgi:hypothetical protein
MTGAGDLRKRRVISVLPRGGHVIAAERNRDDVVVQAVDDALLDS